MLIKKIGLGVVFVALGSQGFAEQITFTHSATGSGNLAGVPFAPTSFTITAVGDTLNRVSFGGGWFIDHGAASIDITGVGSFTFTTVTRTFVNNGASIVGFSRAGSSGADLVNGPNHASYGAWDMTTGIATQTGSGTILQWTSGPIVTSGGVLELDNAAATVTFGANTGPIFTGTAYCFGDGTGVPCPCLAFGGVGEGCLNTAGTGAVLSGSGNATVSNDTFVMDVTGAPGLKPGLLLRGDNQIASPVGDGILCTAGNSQRSHVQVTGATGDTTFNDFNFAAFSSSANIGTPTNYQFWYRDPQNGCSGQGFNFSNAWSVTFLP